MTTYVFPKSAAADDISTHDVLCRAFSAREMIDGIIYDGLRPSLMYGRLTGLWREDALSHIFRKSAADGI